MTMPNPIRLAAYDVGFEGAVRLVVSAPEVTSVRIMRAAPNTPWSVLRMADPLDTTSATGTVVDTEYPFGQDVQYQAVSLAPTAGLLSNIVVWNDPGDPCRMNISDPIVPVLSQWFEVTGREDLASAARGEVVAVVGRREPIAVTDVRGAFAGATEILARAHDTVRQLRELTRTGRPLVMRYPPSWNEPIVYVMVGDVTEARARKAGSNPARLVTLDWQEVAAPRGRARQFLGETYETLRDHVPAIGDAPITYKQLADNTRTYLDLVINGADW